MLSCSKLMLSVLYLLFGPPLVLFNLLPVGLGSRINRLTSSVDRTCVPIATCVFRTLVASECSFGSTIRAESALWTHPLAWRSDQTSVDVQTIHSYCVSIADCVFRPSVFADYNAPAISYACHGWGDTSSNSQITFQGKDLGTSRHKANQTDQEKELHDVVVYKSW